MDIENTWLPTILCAINDALKYNDSLRHSPTVKDAEDIEEWMLQMHQFREHLRDRMKSHPELTEKYEKYLDLY